MVGSQVAHAMAGGFDRLLRPTRHPMVQLLEDAPVTVDDILKVPERIHDTADTVDTADQAAADTADQADWSRAFTAGLDRLLRPDRHPMMQLLGAAPLTVEDILTAPQDPDLQQD
jgi:hypothetical protein